MFGSVRSQIRPRNAPPASLAAVAKRPGNPAFQGSERRESVISQSQRSPVVRGFEQLFELTPAELDYLQRLERAPHHVPARRMLIEEGRKYDRALIVQTGWLIEYVLLRDGKRQILNFRLPGEIVGVDGLAYALMPHSVATLAPGVVADLPLASFEALQCEFPRLASALFLMTLSSTLHLSWRCERQALIQKK